MIISIKYLIINMFSVFLQKYNKVLQYNYAIYVLFLIGINCF